MATAFGDEGVDTEGAKEPEDDWNDEEKAEESDNLKSSFLNNISHEIRTPMNSIIGFSQLIADGNITIEKQNEFSEIIKDNCNQLLDNITNIVEISQIQSINFT